MCDLKAQSKTGYTLFIHLTFWVYLLVGSLVYFVIEAPSYYHPNPQPITINSTFCQILVNTVKSNLGYNDSMWMRNESNQLVYWSTILKESCDGLAFGNTSSSSDGIDSSWEYSSALFLCMSLLTTIGYGDFSPKTDGGKVFVIFYGFIGIPICGLCLATTSNYFSNAFLRLYERHPKLQKKTKYSILVASVVFLLPGLAVFYLIPSGIFVAVEGWDYLDATYFGFITLTTIGFGDIVPAMEAGASWLWFYRVCWIIWVSLGIAYWAIIIGFITKALKSNELKQRWRRTSDAITKQAMEVRRVMSLNSHNLKDRPFVALKSKSAFDFAFQIGSSINSLRCKSRSVSQSRGLQSLMETVTALNEQHYLTTDQPRMNEDGNAETFIQTEEHFNRPTLVNSFSTSNDSGFDDDEIARQDRPTEIITSKTDRVRGFSFSRTVGSRSPSVSSVTSVKPQNETAGKESKGRHLPTVCENVSPTQNQQVYLYSPNMVWQTFGILKNTWAWGIVSNLGHNVKKVLEWGTPRFLISRKHQQAAASAETDPSVHMTNGSQHLQNLLMEAMLILQEAEVEGLNPTEE